VCLFTKGSSYLYMFVLNKRSIVSACVMFGSGAWMVSKLSSNMTLNCGGTSFVFRSHTIGTDFE
jgi:hypothetical protein